MTGKTTAQLVTKVWVNHDTDLMGVTVLSGGVTSVVHSTQHHPFWDTRTRQWTEADLLAVGDGLRTATGGIATAVATKVVPGSAYTWDLPVDNDHDFFVAAGATTVLVHNCPRYRYNGEEDDDAHTNEKMPRGDNQYHNKTAQSAAKAAMKATGGSLDRNEVHNIVSGEGHDSFQSLVDAYVEYINNG